MFSPPNSKALWVVSILILIALVGCSNATPAPTLVPPTPTAQPITLSVSGSGEVWPVLGKIEPGFAADVAGYHLNVISGFGTDVGADAVIKGVLDIATMNRAPNADQASKGVKYVKFGIGAVAIFVHPAVGVSALTLDQVRGIYRGDITNWKQIGGPDLPIIAYNRGGTGGSVGAMQATVFKDLKFAANLQSAATQEDMRNNVAAVPGSIGFGAWPPVLAAGTKVTAVAINGLMPDNPNYPIVEDFGMGYLASKQPIIQPFIDWLLSKNGQTELAKFAVFSPN